MYCIKQTFISVVLYLLTHNRITCMQDFGPILLVVWRREVSNIHPHKLSYFYISVILFIAANGAAG